PVPGYKIGIVFNVHRTGAAKMKYLLSLLCILVVMVSGEAGCLELKDKVTVFGYFEPQFAFQEIDGDYQQLASYKLRVDLEASLSEKVTFQANFDYLTYHGRTTYFIFDFLSDEVTETLPPGSRDIYLYTFEDETFLDNAFIKIAFESFDVTIGKQQISAGVGYAWNPTDLFNQKSILDPSYEQPGHNAVRIDVPLGTSCSFMLLYNPEKDYEESGKYAKIKCHLGHFDLSIMGGERLWTTTDYELFSSVQERRKIVGGDLSGELLGLGIWLEGAYNDLEVTGHYTEALLGFDYTFESGLYLLNEFYYNEQGKDDHEEFNFNDWMHYFSSETKTVTQDQWFFYVSYPATDLLTVGTSVITSLDDQSLVLVPTINYNLDDNCDLSIFGNFYAGQEGKTYSPLLGQGGLIRLRYYF
ncbi:hypothetical protein ACFL27_21170, partial [candidate division CSSED10-310 bacterium]